MSTQPISYEPTDGLSYDPSEPKYWERPALAKEITRVFEVCHGCRMCFKYCDSFPSLFDLIDTVHDGDVRKITDAETDKVFGQCFQCKLCEVQCPYTPRDQHSFQVDFPKLVHRYDAIKTKEEGVRWRDRILGDPDMAGAQARMSMGLANALNSFPPQRWVMEKALGIHRQKLLPTFAPKTFESWAKDEGRIDRGADAGNAPRAFEAVLFQTCYVQNNEPQIGKDTVEVMDANQVDMRCVEGLGCCGMPAWEHGDLETLRKRAKQNLKKLIPYVEKGAKVLAINPTCSMLMRREYPELLEGEDRERAKLLAEAVRDPSEYLWSIRKEERFNDQVKSKPAGGVAYHVPCHLRAQATGFKGRDLLRKILGAKPSTVMECCGHDGTYAMRVEGFEPSQRIGKKAFDGMNEAIEKDGCTTCSTDCPLAAIQFEQHTGRKPLHPMTLLAMGYRGDPFE